jgi:hypothetical protein
MDIDVTALQRLPEIAEVAGLRPKGGVRCLPRQRTKVICIDNTCTQTLIIIKSKPA